MTTYRQVALRNGLADHVACLYDLRIRRGADNASWQRVMPDGAIELNFVLASPLRHRREQNGHTLLTGAYVVSRFHAAYHLQRTGPSHVVGIRFKPGGFTALTGVPAAELSDQVYPAQDVLGKALTRLSDQLTLRSTADPLRALEQWLCSEHRTTATRDRTINTALSSIMAAQGNIRCRDLTKGLSVGLRRLEQRFGKEVGSSPKTFSRLVRFQAALRAIKTVGRGNLMDVVVSCGYFDQAHLNREFKSFAGITPEEYRLQHFPLNDLSLIPPRS